MHVHKSSTHLGQEPPPQVLAAAVGQPEDEVRDGVLSLVGAGALFIQRAQLHVLVERLSQRPLVVLSTYVTSLFII